MQLGKRFATIILSCGLVTSMVGCGFHLRGTQSTPIAQQYQALQLHIPEVANSLKKPLTIYLTNLGARIDQSDAQYALKITDYQQTRQLFSGKLTEVQLRLSVQFHIEDLQGQLITEPRTVISQRSYQYNIETVNTERQEEAFLLQIMQDDLAQQISRQLHANRLPRAIIDQAP